MANEYDKILRESFKDPQSGLLHQLVPSTIVSIRPLLPKLRETILEREADTVAEVETKAGKRFIVHIEWQSSNDPDMAARMALYDLLLNRTYKLEVLGAVLYVGNEPLRMNNTYRFFDFSYQCKMLDVRLLNPELFLSSSDAGEVVFAILTGSGGLAEKAILIRKIFSKLQELYANDPVLLRVKIRQLELLSLLRGEAIQQIIIQEEQKMPVHVDITKDLRYQQGVREGRAEVEDKMIVVAENLIREGLAISFVQKVTGLQLEKLEEIAKRVASSNL